MSDREPPPRIEESGTPPDLPTVVIEVTYIDGKLGYTLTGLPEVRHPLGDIEGVLEGALEQTLALWRKRMTASWLGLKNR